MGPSKLFNKHPGFRSLPLQPVIGANAPKRPQTVRLVLAKISTKHWDSLANAVKMRGKFSAWQQACLSPLLYLSISFASSGSGRGFTQTPIDCSNSPKSIGRRFTTGCSWFKSGFIKLVTGQIEPNATLLAWIGDLMKIIGRKLDGKESHLHLVLEAQ